MKIELRIQQYHGRTDGRTDGHTEWLLELLVGAKNKISTVLPVHVLNVSIVVFASSDMFC